MLEIRLLGTYDVRQNGEPLDIRSRPARTLLAYLLLTIGTHHPRERLAGLLWPDSSERNARKNLRQALWRLRQRIGDRCLLTDTASIAFDPAAEVWLDISVLEGTKGQDAEAAVAAYGGELLPGFYEDWVLLERDRLNAVYERKMERLLDQYLQEHRWPEALEWAERWIAQGQIPEAAYRALMVAHAAAGKLRQVDSAYERCASALQQDLGVEPSEETRDLYERLIERQAHPRDLYPGRPGGTALPRARRSSLPAQATAFIGRKDELTEIEALLGENRLLTLMGPGGIGKTRLALKAASNLAGQFSDGVHFVDLSQIQAPAEVVQIVAEALEYPLSTHQPPESQLLDYLEARQLLLVMDDFTHLVDGARVVSRILRSAPMVKVLATSREKLGLQGETGISVSGMSYPDRDPSGELMKHDAIELFVQSARRAQPSFAPTDQNLRATGRICRLVEGMPLAIELATAWLDTLSLDEIAAELQRSLDILSTEMRDVPDRHQSIRAAFDHSWSMIGEDEREAFARLSVFRGGFTRDAAQTVAGASLDLLARLVGKSFVRHDHRTGRFQIHELMRQYAEERLEQNPQAGFALHGAHSGYYAAFMESRWDHLRDGRQLAALDEIDAELDNVRAAWRYSIGQRDAKRLHQMIHSIRRVYIVRGWNYAGAELFAEAADALEAVPNDEEARAVRAIALAHQAYCMAWLGSADRGIRLAKSGSETLRELDRPMDLALALSAVNLCAQYLKLPEEHRQSAAEMLQIASDLGDQWLEALARFALSTALIDQQKHLEARRNAELSLRISEQLGDEIVSMYALSILGAVALKLSEHPQAMDYYRRCLRASERVGYRWGIENSLKYLGQVALAMDEIEQAVGYFRLSLAIAEEIGLGRDTVNLLYEFARVRAAQDRPEQAVELLTLALEQPASRQARFGEGLIRDSAQQLLDELSAELTGEVYAAAVQRGKRLELTEVVAGLIEKDHLK